MEVVEQRIVHKYKRAGNGLKAHLACGDSVGWQEGYSNYWKKVTCKKCLEHQQGKAEQ